MGGNKGTCPPPRPPWRIEGVDAPCIPPFLGIIFFSEPFPQYPPPQPEWLGGGGIANLEDVAGLGGEDLLHGERPVGELQAAQGRERGDGCAGRGERMAVGCMREPHAKEQRGRAMGS